MGIAALMRGIRILAAIVALLAGSLAGAAAITDRMSLIEAIEAVREQGFEIVYSSQLVAPWSHVVCRFVERVHRSHASVAENALPFGSNVSVSDKEISHA